MKRLALLALALLALAGPPAASADGLPVLGIDVGGSGVTVPGALSRYVTVQTTGGTLVERINRNGGQVLVSSLFSGTYTIPAVAYDGSAGGLSADRHTLALIEPRQSFPRARTKLLVLDVPALRYRATVHLRGDFSFDAISPDGSRLFLIQYLSPTDPTRYAVRSYDVRAERLDARRIVDATNPRETMRGNPISRAASADGRWAYTLYDGGGGTPFVHALDTRAATARCVDLDGLDLSTVGRLRLHIAHGGRAVAVVDRTTTMRMIDTRTLAVAVPGTGGATPWRWIAAAVAAGLALVAIGIGSARGRTRRRPQEGPALQ